MSRPVLTRVVMTRRKDLQLPEWRLLLLSSWDELALWPRLTGRWSLPVGKCVASGGQERDGCCHLPALCIYGWTGADRACFSEICEWCPSEGTL